MYSVWVNRFQGYFLLKFPRIYFLLGIVDPNPVASQIY